MPVGDLKRLPTEMQRIYTIAWLLLRAQTDRSVPVLLVTPDEGESPRARTDDGRFYLLEAMTRCRPNVGSVTWRIVPRIWDL